MIETETREATLCACTVEIAELFAGMPSASVDGQLLDLLAHRLEASRDRQPPLVITPQPPSTRTF
ncbi:hypothetical protein D3C72_2038680 [compost metagenome]